MALYSYTKHTKKRSRYRYIRMGSYILIVSGLFILFWVLYPILSFELFYAPRFGSNLVTPLANSTFAQTLKQEVSQVLGISDTDYTKASIWFPKSVGIKTARSDSVYTLSIPKVRIENATVIVGSEDLSKSLIQFTGPLPGNVGNPVILGHSTLPFLYNPKDYKTIFSKLPDLKIGDDVYITSDSITYRYSIYNMKIVSAEDVTILEQNYNYENITLVTCVPPGTYFKRLVVKAKLIKI